MARAARRYARAATRSSAAALSDLAPAAGSGIVIVHCRRRGRPRRGIGRGGTSGISRSGKRRCMSFRQRARSVLGVRAKAGWGPRSIRANRQSNPNPSLERRIEAPRRSRFANRTSRFSIGSKSREPRCCGRRFPKRVHREADLPVLVTNRRPSCPVLASRRNCSGSSGSSTRAGLAEPARAARFARRVSHGWLLTLAAFSRSGWRKAHDRRARDLRSAHARRDVARRERYGRRPRPPASRCPRSRSTSRRAERLRTGARRDAALSR